MPAVTVCADLDSDAADRVRSLATAEHRRVSNRVAAAVHVFTDLPKGVHDALSEMSVDADPN